MAFDVGIAVAERQAREILVSLGLDRIAELDLRDIAYVRGLLVQTSPMRGAQGRLVRQGSRAIATVDTAIRQRGQQRFVLAHELGHFELHADEPIFVCDQRAFLDWHRRRPAETEANRFAAELLMPKAVFLEDASRMMLSFDAIRELAVGFGASLTATAFRFVHLDVSPSALICCTQGEVAWTLLSKSFPYRRVRRSGPLHPYTGAAEYFRDGKTSSQPEPTPAYAWFFDEAAGADKRCMEHCFPMPSYGSTLSLIWE